MKILATVGLLLLPSVLLAQRTVDFSLPDGPIDQGRMEALFGGGKFDPARGFAGIRNGVLEVTYVAGKKVRETGFSAHVPVPPSQDLELRFRIRYPEDFQPGLHGKQLGLSGGKGYDGGRGEEARINGNGWSIRLQFDALREGVRNSLYVYHVNMSGKYGDPVGAGSFVLTRGAWHEVRLRLRMQSAPDAADGAIEVWLDGEKKINRTGFQFVSKEEGRCIDRVRVEMFPGGGGDFPLRDQVFALDDVAWGPSGTTGTGPTWWEWVRGWSGL